MGADAFSSLAFFPALVCSLNLADVGTTDCCPCILYHFQVKNSCLLATNFPYSTSTRIRSTKLPLFSICLYASKGTAIHMVKSKIQAMKNGTIGNQKAAPI